MGLCRWKCLNFCFKQKTAYEMRISDWSLDVCSSDLKSGAAPDQGSQTDMSVALITREQAAHDPRPLIVGLGGTLSEASSSERALRYALELGRASCRERVSPYV